METGKELPKDPQTVNNNKLNKKRKKVALILLRTGLVAFVSP
jgi:hypothetical protein